MKATVTFEIDTENLQCWTDQHLVQLFHIAQANPADGFKSREPGLLAQQIGGEIIRRFLKRTEPELWHHQAGNYDFGKAHLTAVPTTPNQPQPSQVAR